ncbi:MAG: hypothetical protein JXM75_10350 [Chromatiaceae bacterium]|nr:hypothetical protein [Chromatiaceae bacterium]
MIETWLVTPSDWLSPILDPFGLPLVASIDTQTLAVATAPPDSGSAPSAHGAFALSSANLSRPLTSAPFAGGGTGLLLGEMHIAQQTQAAALSAAPLYAQATASATAISPPLLILEPNDAWIEVRWNIETLNLAATPQAALAYSAQSLDVLVEPLSGAPPIHESLGIALLVDSLGLQLTTWEPEESQTLAQWSLSQSWGPLSSGLNAFLTAPEPLSFTLALPDEPALVSFAASALALAYEAPLIERTEPRPLAAPPSWLLIVTALVLLSWASCARRAARE